MSIFTAIGVVIPLYIGCSVNCVTDTFEGVIGVPSKNRVALDTVYLLLASANCNSNVPISVPNTLFVSLTICALLKD